MLGSVFVAFLSFLGILDAGYLTWEHLSGVIPPCGTGIFADCGKVLSSSYAYILGIPLAAFGLVFYVTEFMLALFSFRWAWPKRLLVLTTAGGFLFSLYLVSLMVFVIQALCLYCLLSAIISTVLFFIVQILFWKERKEVVIELFAFLYPRIGKPVFFLFDPEQIHETMVWIGSMLGRFAVIRWFFSYCFIWKDKRLERHIAGIIFPNPVGLAAGYDYEANLTQITGPLGFGFHTVGTITNRPYEGNSPPRLGRLPKSRSILVNKGYKNLGAMATIRKLEGKIFSIPVGISIGATNDPSITTLRQVIADIRACFEQFEASRVRHAYYELNISCPNLSLEVSLYDPMHLDALLRAIDHLKLSRPVFIKMPIEKTEKEYAAMLDVILTHKIAGVIIGNLSKDRNNPALDPDEVAKCSVGNFSGKPTWESSNRLIAFTRKYVKRKLSIIGCGGIFSPEDAAEKLRLGADMVQLITGMIYQGPHLTSQVVRVFLKE